MTIFFFMRQASLWLPSVTTSDRKWSATPYAGGLNP